MWLFIAEPISHVSPIGKEKCVAQPTYPFKKSLNIQKALLMNELHKKLCIDIIQQTVWTYTSEKLVCLENLQTHNGAKKLFILNYLHSICLTFSC